MALSRTLEKIEEISSRLKIIEILSNYFRSVILLSDRDLLASVYLCLNKIAPAYEGIELGIAETFLMKVINSCFCSYRIYWLASKHYYYFFFFI